MANTAQKAILRAKIAGVLKDLMVKTTAEQVYLDGSTTLAGKLAELIEALNGKAPSSHVHTQTDVTGLVDELNSRPTTTTMNTAISEAISQLIDGAPETYDTLKEIAEYIGSNEDAMTVLNKAIGGKADTLTVTALQETVSAIKTTVSSLEKVSHSHSNKTTLDGITSDLVEKWSGKSKIYYSSTEPSDLTDGDKWVQLLD